MLRDPAPQHYGFTCICLPLGVLYRIDPLSARVISRTENASVYVPAEFVTSACSRDKRSDRSGLVQNMERIAC
jgi:hypothetical protein